VALSYGNQYNLVAMASDSSPWMTALTGVTVSSTGTAWAPWGTMGGVFLSKVGIAGWSRGFRLYGIGTDHALWQQSFDNDRWNSTWFSLGGSYTGSMVQGVSAVGLQPQLNKISVFVNDATGRPSLIRYPR
jgi:hypothetical protein